MRSPASLKHVVAVAISGLAGFLIVLLTLTVEQAGIEQLQAEIGHRLKMLADQMQDRLDHTLFERSREIDIAASMLARLADADRPRLVRAWLSDMQSSNPAYAWIGLADASGKVLYGTGGAREGRDVSQKRWFRSGLSDVTVGRVHRPSRESAATLSPGTSGQRLDISAPVRDANGRTTAVLGAQLDWRWARQVRDLLFGAASTQDGEEVLVLDREGTVLLGPPSIAGKTLPIPSADGGSATSWSDTRRWPDGDTYVAGYAHQEGQEGFSGLGWTVLVRQSTDTALAPVRRLRYQGIAWSVMLAGLAGIAGWLLANRIAAPMLELATAADAVRRGEQFRLPAIGNYAEAAMLQASLSSLVEELRRRQASLLELNQSLEAKVARRTSELAGQNAELEAARQAAEAAHLTKSRFLAAASHDLRQPLQAMLLFARALSRRVSGPEAKRLVEQLELSMGNLKQMFDALLDVSRLDEGLIQPNLAPVSINELLTRVAAEFKAVAQARGLRFDCRATEAAVSTDAILLERMLRNLVSNALKFTRSGGVLLSARRIKGRIAIQVWDSGPGIDEHRRSRIFEEFERSPEHASGANEGLGLGLAIVRRYAHLLDIDIELSSRPGKGTRVSLLLPANTDTQSAAIQKPPSQSTAPTGLRVLLLDDDSNLVAGMSRELADRGCHPLVYSKVDEAIAALNSTRDFDAAIVDFDLGAQGNGLAVLEAAERVRGASVSALILTGATDPAIADAIRASRRPWLAKPADPDLVVQRLSEIAGERVHRRSHPT
ncbi:MAG: ATP-binding protein [Hyphomicrobiaceae bacterium]